MTTDQEVWGSNPYGCALIINRLHHLFEVSGFWFDTQFDTQTGLFLFFIHFSLPPPQTKTVRSWWLHIGRGRIERKVLETKNEISQVTERDLPLEYL